MSSDNFDIGDLKRRMQGATASLKHDLGGLRTGRASISMVEPVQVEAYGTHMPLNQVATVSVPEPVFTSEPGPLITPAKIVFVWSPPTVRMPLLETIAPATPASEPMVCDERPCT